MAGPLLPETAASRLNAIDVEVNDLYSAFDAKAELDALLPDIESALELLDEDAEDRTNAKPLSKALSAAVLVLSFAGTIQAAEPSQYAQRTREVTEHIQKNFFDSQSGVYFKSVTVRKPDYVWLQSVMFSNLVAAARSEPATYGPLLQKYFTALDGYWDPKVKIPGYEAAPTRGNGNDKYYDDNAWLVITFLEAYETNRARTTSRGRTRR